MKGSLFTGGNAGNKIRIEVEDSWKDIAGYAILALIELREGR